MNFIQNREADERPNAWPICDKCKQPSDQLEPVGECEGYQAWCLECIRTEVRAMLDEHAHDDEMRSLRGLHAGELDRI
jgi:hypothetical protein